MVSGEYEAECRYSGVLRAGRRGVAVNMRPRVYGQEGRRTAKRMKGNQTKAPSTRMDPFGGNRLVRWRSACPCGRSIGHASEWRRYSRWTAHFPTKTSLSHSSRCPFLLQPSTFDNCTSYGRHLLRDHNLTRQAHSPERNRTRLCALYSLDSVAPSTPLTPIDPETKG